MTDRFHSFTVLIGSISRSIRRLKTDEVKEYNLSSSHVSCIYYLYKCEGLTSKELTNICEEDKALISRSLDYLERNGFITCNSVAKKRYKNALYLTSKGNEVGKALVERIDHILDLASEGLSEENRLILYQSLELINDNLSRLAEKKGE